MTLAPFMTDIMDIKEDWIDYNGHLNMAYYNVLFDEGADQAYPLLGFGPDYAKTRKLTTYVAEFHIRYIRELHLKDQVRSSFQILDHDEKRIHTYQKLIHQDGWVAASAETLILHVDMTGPKVTPMPHDIKAKVDAMALDHANVPSPQNIGRPIGLRRS